MQTWPSKDPDEVKDYGFDWTQYRLEAGETIATSTWTVDEGDVVIDSDTEDAGISSVMLSGGTGGTTALLRNRVTTSAGRTYDWSAKLPIRGH